MKRINAQEIADRIIAQLANNIAPWVRPWNVAEPHNAKSGHKYSGINYILLAQDKEGPSYLTWNQIQELGGHIKAGATGRRITFVAPVTVKVKDANNNKTDETKRISLLKSYTVFPVSCIENLPAKYYEKTERVIPTHEEAEALFEVVDVRVGGGQAYYSPSSDYIQMPPRETFGSMEEYYSTKFHELIHWTKAAERCNRERTESLESRAKEELVAEIGAAMLCHHFGIDLVVTHNPDGTISDNTAAYCKGWGNA